MRFLMLILTCLLFPLFAMAGSMELVAEYNWVGVLVIVIVEFLLANTKVISANSTVDMVLNILKFIFVREKK